jgi:hypothetical protein
MSEHACPGQAAQVRFSLPMYDLVNPGTGWRVAVKYARDALLSNLTGERMIQRHVSGATGPPAPVCQVQPSSLS